MAILTDIVFDSVDPPKLAQFWASALDGYNIRPYDQQEIDRLAKQGLTPETDPAVAVDGPGPTLFFQMTSDPKESRNRVHLDIQDRDRFQEVRRLTSRGATIRDEHATFTVLLDPEGNEFCVFDAKDQT